MGLNMYARRGKAQLTTLSIDMRDAPTGAADATTHTVTLTADQAQAEYIKLTGATVSDSILQFPFTPKDAGMQIIINNGTTNGGSAIQTLKAITADNGSTPTTGLAVTQAKKVVVVYDGTDFVAVTTDK